jgi:uncharacterized caspase-like protein
MFRWLSYLGMLLAFMITAIVGAIAKDRRVALVIGNSAYKHLRELPNPKHDAADMATALRTMGFEVTAAFDLDKRSLDRELGEFAQALPDSDVGLFFFAGHGLQASGRNYLLPVDVQLNSVAALEAGTTSLEAVYRAMAATKARIIFLDASRDNPLEPTGAAPSQQGLVPMPGAAAVIGFSTQPGRAAWEGAGRNSPYTASLIRRMQAPGEELSSILAGVRRDVVAATNGKQIPWEHSSLPQHFTIVPAASQK